MSNKTMPHIRFAAYSNDWSRVYLDDVAQGFDYGMNAASKNYDGENKYLRITDIDPDTNLFNQKALVSPAYNGNLPDAYRLKPGDIVFARTGASVGKTYMYSDADEKVYFAGYLIRASIKIGFNINFIYQQTLTHSYAKFVQFMSQRSGQPGINANEYRRLPICTTSFPEQQKIGQLFQKLDRLIYLQHQQVETNRKLKDAMLQRMFPAKGETMPEIRFEGFSGEWEEYKLKEQSAIVKGKQLAKEAVKGDGLYYHLNGGISPSGRTDLWNTPANTISISEGGNSCGYVNWNSESFFSGGHNYTLQIKEGIDSYFLFSYLKFKEKEIMALRVGSGLPNIQKKDIETFIVLKTNLREQQRIGSFFQKLDQKIALEEKRLEGYQSLKQALLQRMFV